METAKKKTGRAGPWANLVICGGLSWGVNVWHAMNISGAAHWQWILAVMFGTAPVVVAAIQSHHMAKGGAGTKKRLLTYAVFAMGMALSINAQATAVAPYAPHYGLNWVFPVMLDVSAFLALHSLMEGVAETVETGSEETEGTGSSPVSETGQKTAEETGKTGSLETAETGSPSVSETGSRDRQETVRETAEKTVRTGREDRPRPTPRRTRKAAAPPDRDTLIRSLNQAHIDEHGRPISADKLVLEVRAAGHALGKAKALEILADLNAPTLAVVK